MIEFLILNKCKWVLVSIQITSLLKIQTFWIQFNQLTKTSTQKCWDKEALCLMLGKLCQTSWGWIKWIAKVIQVLLKAKMVVDRPILLTQAIEIEELQETWVNFKDLTLALNTTLTLEQTGKEGLWSLQVG